MGYGYAHLELLLMAIEAERQHEYERGRALREFRSLDAQASSPRRSRMHLAVRELAGGKRRSRRITQAVRRVAGMIAAGGAK